MSGTDLFSVLFFVLLVLLIIRLMRLVRFAKAMHSTEGAERRVAVTNFIIHFIVCLVLIFALTLYLLPYFIDTLKKLFPESSL